MYIKTNENNMVIGIYHNENEHSEEILAECYFVEGDEIPKAEAPVGKEGRLYYTEKEGFRWEYVDRPLTDKERIEQLELLVMSLGGALGGK